LTGAIAISHITLVWRMQALHRDTIDLLLGLYKFCTRPIKIKGIVPQVLLVLLYCSAMYELECSMNASIGFEIHYSRLRESNNEQESLLSSTNGNCLSQKMILVVIVVFVFIAHRLNCGNAQRIIII
jgi:hypothetical protein